MVQARVIGGGPGRWGEVCRGQAIPSLTVASPRGSLLFGSLHLIHRPFIIVKYTRHKVYHLKHFVVSGSVALSTAPPSITELSSPRTTPRRHPPVPGTHLLLSVSTRRLL